MNEVLFLVTDDKLSELIQIDILEGEDKEYAGHELRIKDPETTVYFGDLKLNNFLNLIFNVNSERQLKVYQENVLIFTCDLVKKFISVIKSDNNEIHFVIRLLSDLDERIKPVFEFVFKNYDHSTETALLYRPVYSEKAIKIQEDNLMHPALEIDTALDKLKEYVEIAKRVTKFVSTGNMNDYYMYYEGRLYNILDELVVSRNIVVEPIGENLGIISMDLTLLDEEEIKFISKDQAIIYENITLDGNHIDYYNTPFATLENLYKKFKMAFSSPDCPIEPLEDYKGMFDDVLERIFSIDTMRNSIEKGYVFINHGEMRIFNLNNINDLLNSMDKDLEIIREFKKNQIEEQE